VGPVKNSREGVLDGVVYQEVQYIHHFMDERKSLTARTPPPTRLSHPSVVLLRMTPFLPGAERKPVPQEPLPVGISFSLSLQSRRKSVSVAFRQ